jgi:hypothetical protein
MVKETSLEVKESKKSEEKHKTTTRSEKKAANKKAGDSDKVSVPQNNYFPSLRCIYAGKVRPQNVLWQQWLRLPWPDLLGRRDSNRTNVFVLCRPRKRG